MRKLIVFNIMTLDGYYEGPGGDVMDLFNYRLEEYPKDESFDKYNVERLAHADTLLLGHKSYEGFMGYWPSVADNPSVDPVERDISRRMNAIYKVVISDKLTIKESDPWQNTRVIKLQDARKEIAKLKHQPGKDILVFASHFLWNDLLNNELVDEIHLMVGPVVLGTGAPIFSQKPNVSLRLIDTLTRKGSGTVLIRYKVQVV